jgi:hypothetical protein
MTATLNSIQQLDKCQTHHCRSLILSTVEAGARKLRSGTLEPPLPPQLGSSSTRRQSEHGCATETLRVCGSPTPGNSHAIWGSAQDAVSKHARHGRTGASLFVRSLPVSLRCATASQMQLQSSKPTLLAGFTRQEPTCRGREPDEAKYDLCPLRIIKKASSGPRLRKGSACLKAANRRQSSLSKRSVPINIGKHQT